MKNLEHFLEESQKYIQARRNPKFKKAFGFFLIGGSILFLGISLARGWGEIQDYLREANIMLLFVGQGCTLIALLLGGVMWSLIQKSIGLGFSWKESLSIQFVSGITKYLPGYAWQYMSKAYMSKEHGATSQQIFRALLTEFIYLMLGGIVLGSSTAGFFTLKGGFFQAVPNWIWLIVSIGAISGLLGWSLRVVSSNLSSSKKHQRWLLLGAFIAGMVGWLILSTATWFVTRAFYPLEIQDFPLTIVAQIFSGIISFLVLFVPGGIGVREATLAILLNGIIPMPVGIIVSIMLRLSIIIAELLVFVIVISSKTNWKIWQKTGFTPPDYGK
jgi:glycosyltransferase 2 family protein